jgi:hypothetical protein
MSALDKQVGGDHYKTQGIQPLEITYLNYGYEGLSAAVYTKVNKYLTRDKGDHLENLDKAIHCIEIQKEIYERDAKVKNTTAEPEPPPDNYLEVQTRKS